MESDSHLSGAPSFRPMGDVPKSISFFTKDSAMGAVFPNYPVRGVWDSPTRSELPNRLEQTPPLYQNPRKFVLWARMRPSYQVVIWSELKWSDRSIVYMLVGKLTWTHLQRCVLISEADFRLRRRPSSMCILDRATEMVRNRYGLYIFWPNAYIWRFGEVFRVAHFKVRCMRLCIILVALEFVRFVYSVDPMACASPVRILSAPLRILELHDPVFADCGWRRGQFPTPRAKWWEPLIYCSTHQDVLRIGRPMGKEGSRDTMSLRGHSAS